ncbi:MAG: alpha/beta hydrolase [Pseudomonadota bacterium]
MRNIALLLLIAAVVFITALYFGQRKILFPAPGDGRPLALPADVELIEARVGYGLLAKPLDGEGPAPLIVFAHGNGEVAHWWLEAFRHFRELGFAILLLEYPGYAGAPGSPTAASIEESALQALDLVSKRQDIDEQRIIAYGRSIGSGVACLLAAKRPVAALVLESAFSSLRSLVKEHGYPAFLLRDQFDNDQIVPELDIPVFLYHGRNDKLIPFSHTQRLAELAKRARLVEVNCGHNNCPRPWPQLTQFLGAAQLIDKD